jgi:hypothetical protein
MRLMTYLKDIRQAIGSGYRVPTGQQDLARNESCGRLVSHVMEHALATAPPRL